MHRSGSIFFFPFLPSAFTGRLEGCKAMLCSRRCRGPGPAGPGPGPAGDALPLPRSQERAGADQPRSPGLVRCSPRRAGDVLRPLCRSWKRAEGLETPSPSAVTQAGSCAASFEAERPGSRKARRPTYISLGTIPHRHQCGEW